MGKADNDMVVVDPNMRVYRIRFAGGGCEQLPFSSALSFSGNGICVGRKGSR